MKTKISALIVSAMLAACASQAPVAPLEIRQPPADCMLKCDPLDPPKDASLAETYRAGVAAAHSKKECARRHACLVDWVGAR